MQYILTQEELDKLKYNKELEYYKDISKIAYDLMDKYPRLKQTANELNSSDPYELMKLEINSLVQLTAAKYDNYL